MTHPSSLEEDKEGEQINLREAASGENKDVNSNKLQGKEPTATTNQPPSKDEDELYYYCLFRFHKFLKSLSFVCKMYNCKF
jgi:hypothetical protein